MKKLGNISGYKIMLSSHARLRSKQRNIDTLQSLAAILAMGADRLKEYEANTADIMIQDTDNNFSVVFAVKPGRIEIITLLDKADCYAKTGTNVVKI